MTRRAFPSESGWSSGEIVEVFSVKRLAHSLPGAVRPRSVIVAALATITACADPALALDKVKFGTNWLADPEQADSMRRWSTGHTRNTGST